MRGSGVALPRRFTAVVQDRMRHDADSAGALLREAIAVLRSGNVATGKPISRDDIKATVGFDPRGVAVDTEPKGFVRMFSPRGKPQARKPFGIIGYL